MKLNFQRINQKIWKDDVFVKFENYKGKAEDCFICCLAHQWSGGWVQGRVGVQREIMPF